MEIKKNFLSGNLLLLLPVSIHIACQLLFIGWIPDDAFISFRYAHNLAGGLGLTFNPGEHVEGFSNMLWTLGLSAGSRLGIDIVRLAVGASMAASAGAVFLTAALMKRAAAEKADSRQPGVRFLFNAFIIVSACFFPLAFYASSGLESTAYLFLILLGSILNIEGTARSNRRMACLSAAAFLPASLMRPEGVIFLAANAAVLYREGKSSPAARRIIGAGLPLLLYFGAALWKYSYFGSFLPNTYFAKPGATPVYAAPLLAGVSYLARLFAKSGMVVFLPFIFIPPSEEKMRYCWKYCWLVVSIQLLFIVYVGADVLRFDRFSLPFFPFFMTLAFMGLCTVMNSLKGNLKTVVYRTAIISLCLMLILNFAQAFKVLRNVCVHDWMHSGTLRSIGRDLEHSLESGSTIAANEIGAISYYSNHKVIDMLGLTDRKISRIRFDSFQKYNKGSSPESVDKIVDYIFSMNPECLVLPSYENISGLSPDRIDTAMHPLWAGIYRRLQSGDFVLKRTYKINEIKFKNIYIRRGIRFTAQASRSRGNTDPCSRVIEY